MRIGICPEYDHCSLARNSVMQEIEEFSPFFCRECANLLQETKENTSNEQSIHPHPPQQAKEAQVHTQSRTEAQDLTQQQSNNQNNKSSKHPVPIWFKLIILFSFIIIGIVTFLFFFISDSPEVPIIQAPEPPLVIAAIIDTVPDTVIMFDNTKAFAFQEGLGPFLTSVPVDTFLLSVIEANGLVYDTLTEFIRDTIYTYELNPKTQSANITFNIKPVYMGLPGIPIIIKRSFEAKPIVVERFVRANRRNQRFDLPTGYHFLKIPQQILSVDQAPPNEIRWSLNRERTSEVIDKTSIPVSGVNLIPEFELFFFEEPKNAQVVFNISPIKTGFTSVSSTFVIEIRGNPCASNYLINEFNANVESIANAMRNELRGSISIMDPEEKSYYLNQAKTLYMQLVDVLVEVEGFVSFDEFINSGFSRLPEISFDKNVCNKINRIRVKP